MSSAGGLIAAAAFAAGASLLAPHPARAAINASATYTNAAGGSWATTSNWDVNDFPSGTNAAAIFASNQTAARAITLDGAVTLNAWSVDNSTAFANTFNNGTGGSLTWDGNSPTFTVTGNATTGNAVPLTVSATTTLNKLLTFNVGPTSSTSQAGTFNYTGSMSGSGGIIKTGDGTLSLGTGNRTYTGETIVNAGRLRISVASAPKNSSKVTVNAGGQITFSTAGAITLGAGSVYLNGTGNTVFPAAIRADQLGMSITNPIVLQTDSSISVIHTANSLTLPGVISGPGRLEMGTMPGDATDQGTLTLQATNTYTGGTLVTQGRMILSGASATLGTGNVSVDGVSTSGTSVARGIVEIATGVTDGIADTASVSLTGGGPAAGTADGGSMVLNAGVNEIVNGLVLGGTPQAFGTYGSSASAATFKNDEFFSGTGILTVAPVPEPGSIALLGLGAAGLLARRRKR